MKDLIKAEWFKLKKMAAYKALFITYLIVEAAVQMNNISNSVVYPQYNPTYTGAEWLENLQQALLLYSIVVFLFAALYVNGDFVKRTFYSGLLCGVPRKKAFLAKMVSTFAGVIPLMLVPVLTGTVLWSIHAGFGMNFGVEAVCLVAKTLAIQFLASLMLISHAAFFAVLIKSRIGAFVWSFGTLYVSGVLRGNIGNIVQIPVLRESLLFLLSVSYLNLGTFLVAIAINFLAAGYIFERCDLK